ncbi:YtrH family sporulation protein [Tumebacillus sp. DT12]|uniref:YtrH family sporulation protein n=1 Tax=Tumebacillus lacus TaxID=2995335 RepID=A0ABT3X222_9BACL|nr:YtrH family sporulation protein [Tumebacillus lacus]MCX7569993.1 YtrH family sporulation protein [Tumebacillus lacus]
MERFISTVILDFFVALGIVLGGSIIGALGAVLTHRPPMTTMVYLGDQLKIWALVAALGGTMDTLKVFDTGLFGGAQFAVVVKQFCYLVSAFLGCNVGYYLIKWIVGEIK